MPLKVIVAMSGGIDSSVTAYLLKQKGYEVEGVSFILYDDKGIKASHESTKGLSDSLKIAQKTAEVIGIKHSIIDLRKEFANKIIAPFIYYYSKGETPNPCIQCNKHIKFPNLIKIANEKGADFIATGHYAKIENHGDSIILCRAQDIKKDQSYFLYAVDKNILKRVLLPLGNKIKEEVKGIASFLNIPSINNSESQEICFIQNKRYYEFLEKICEPKGGPIIDAHTNNVIGFHRGVHLYTIGQRKRLGIAQGEPRYVVKIDAAKNAVYIGRKEFAMFKSIIVDNINLLKSQQKTFRATIKIRSRMRDEPGSLELINNNQAKVIFDRPQWAPAIGQSAVFYEGDVLVGGGIIVSSSKEE